MSMLCVFVTHQVMFIAITVCCALFVFMSLRNVSYNQYILQIYQYNNNINKL